MLLGTQLTFAIAGISPEIEIKWPFKRKGRGWYPLPSASGTHRCVTTPDVARTFNSSTSGCKKESRSKDLLTLMSRLPESDERAISLCPVPRLPAVLTRDDTAANLIFLSVTQLRVQGEQRDDDRPTVKPIPYETLNTV